MSLKVVRNDAISQFNSSKLDNSCGKFIHHISMLSSIRSIFVRIRFDLLVF